MLYLYERFEKSCLDQRTLGESISPVSSLSARWEGFCMWQGHEGVSLLDNGVQTFSDSSELDVLGNPVTRSTINSVTNTIRVQEDTPACQVAIMTDNS